MSVLAGPPPLYVRWSCRRCGHQGGIARTTVPVVGWSTEMYQHLLQSLRQRLTRKHLDQGCVATVEDFRIEPFVPDGKTLLDRV